MGCVLGDQTESGVEGAEEGGDDGLVVDRVSVVYCYCRIGHVFEKGGLTEYKDLKPNLHAGIQNFKLNTEF